MKKSAIAIILLAVVLAFTASSATIQTINAEKHKQKIYSGYSKSFYELTEHIEKIDTSLKKASLASDSHSLLSLGAAISESAAFALSDLSEMETAAPLINISSFLNQSGDYVKAVALAHSDGSRPTKEEQDTFSMLSVFSELLKNELFLIREKIASGEISYSAALSDADEKLGEHLSEIEDKHFSSYKALSYEGAFSSHMENAQSTYLSLFPEITKEEALTLALGYTEGDIPLIYKGETDGLIPSFMFHYEGKGSAYSMEVSKKGGKLLYYSESRAIGDVKVGEEEALYHARAFAEQSGYKNVIPVFYETSGGIITVTLAPSYDEVIYYSDLIKVEVALDTSSVVGFYAKNYLMNHKNRIFPEISQKSYDVISEINDGFLLKSLKKCYIPTKFNTEIPCLEAMGVFEDRSYMIYINAETGIQEEILLLSVNEGEYIAS